MSAFIVPKAHIDALVFVAQHGPKNDASRMGWYPIRFDGDIGAAMIAENVTSVRTRYGSRAGEVPEKPYVLEPVRHLSTVEALKAINCYVYQSCEHEGWKASPVRDWCENLAGSLAGCRCRPGTGWFASWAMTANSTR